jgi:hypothetical protein
MQTGGQEAAALVGGRGAARTLQDGKRFVVGDAYTASSQLPPRPSSSGSHKPSARPASVLMSSPPPFIGISTESIKTCTESIGDGQDSSDTHRSTVLCTQRDGGSAGRAQRPASARARLQQAPVSFAPVSFAPPHAKPSRAQEEESRRPDGSGASALAHHKLVLLPPPPPPSAPTPHAPQGAHDRYRDAVRRIPFGHVQRQVRGPLHMPHRGGFQLTGGGSSSAGGVPDALCHPREPESRLDASPRAHELQSFRLCGRPHSSAGPPRSSVLCAHTLRDDASACSEQRPDERDTPPAKPASKRPASARPRLQQALVSLAPPHAAESAQETELEEAWGAGEGGGGGVTLVRKCEACDTASGAAAATAASALTTSSAASADVCVGGVSRSWGGGEGGMSRSWGGAKGAFKPSFSVSSNIKDTNIKDPHSLGGGLRRTASAGLPRSNTSYLRSNASNVGAGGASARLCLVAPAQHRCFELPRPRALVRPYATQICGLKRGLKLLRYAAVLRTAASKLLVYEALSYLSY